MNIEAKLQDFEKSLNRISNEDYNKIEKKIEEEIQAGIREELSEYENKKQIAYDKYVQKMEKDFNKKIFNYEMNCKKEIIEEEKKIKNLIKKDAINLLKEYTQKPEYEQFLIKSIKERSIKNRRHRKHIYWISKKRYRKIWQQHN